MNANPQYHERLNPDREALEAISMAAKPVVRARIDEHLKAEAILASIGLTVSDAFRMMIVRIVREKALPFGPLVPNDETIAAMKAARRGELLTAGRPEDLLENLNAGD